MCGLIKPQSTIVTNMSQRCRKKRVRYSVSISGTLSQTGPWQCNYRGTLHGGPNQLGLIINLLNGHGNQRPIGIGYMISSFVYWLSIPIDMGVGMIMSPSMTLLRNHQLESPIPVRLLNRPSLCRNGFGLKTM